MNKYYKSMRKNMKSKYKPWKILYNVKLNKSMSKKYNNYKIENKLCKLSLM